MRPFEKFVKRKLDGYEPEVPPHIWENIEARKKRRGFFWFFLEGRAKYISLPVLLLAIGVFSYMVINRENRSSGSKELFNTAARHSLTIPEKIDNSENSGERPAEKRKIPAATLIKSGESPTLNPDSSPENNILNSQINQSKDEWASMVASGSASIQEVRSAAKPSGKMTPTIEADLTSRKTESRYVPIGNKRLGESSKPSTEQIVGDSRNSTDNISPISVQVINFENSEILETNKEQSEEKALIPFHFEPQKLMNRTPTLTLIYPFSKNHSIPPCPGDLPSAKLKYLELFAGPDLVFTSYSDTSSSNYINRRKSATEISFAYSAGARFTKVFGNGMSVKTGINFSQIIEKFSVLQGNVIQIIYILGPSGDTIGNYATRTSRYLKSRNNYHTVDIPLLIGYEMNIGKWKANLNAGVMMNIYSWQNGLMIDTSGKVVSIKSGSGSQDYQFKTNMGMGFLGSLSLYYPLREGLYLMAEPYFRYNLSAANREEISLRQRFHNAGIRFGLRFDLKK